MTTKYYQPKPQSELENTGHKSPLLIGTVIVTSLSLIGISIIPWLNKPMLHIRAEDFSDSSMKYAVQRKVYCQAGSQNYQSGDTAVTIAFSDDSIITKKLEIENSLSMLGQCLNSDRPITNKHPGTSLISVLEKGKEAINSYYQEHENPVVFTILANAFEPTPGKTIQPEAIHNLISEITQKKTIIAFILPPKSVNSDLISDLNEEKNIVICPMSESENEAEVKQSIQPCMKTAFAKARKL